MLSLVLPAPYRVSQGLPLREEGQWRPDGALGQLLPRNLTVIPPKPPDRRTEKEKEKEKKASLRRSGIHVGARSLCRVPKGELDFFNAEQIFLCIFGRVNAPDSSQV